MKTLIIIATMFLTFSYLDSQVVIRQGKYHTGDALYNWDGEVLRQGKYHTGDAVLNVDGKIPMAILIFIAQ
jgi:hypothetical protein